MKNLAIFFFRFLMVSFSQKLRYIRLSPNLTGKIFFFDKKEKKVFSIFSRDWADSATADSIYTHYDYGLEFLIRYQELVDEFNSIVRDHKIPLIIDCGANIGLSTRYFAEEFPDAKVIAVEPEKTNFEMMKKNCAHLENISLKNLAIGSRKGFVKIYDNSADNNAFRTTRDEATKDIEVVTISELLDEDTATKPFIIKIDIEGFEEDLFSDNTGWLKDVPILIIETHDWMLPREASSRNFLKTISQEDRDFILKGENIISISNSLQL